MLLTLTTTYEPATDLGYLLAKNPSRVQSFALSFGQAHVFYPEARHARCTAALALDVDPVALVRGRHGTTAEGGTFDHYVNDRPYAASSFLSVAIADVFRSALGGRSKERPELVGTELPLEARVVALPCRGGGEQLVHELFQPLGYGVATEPYPPDARFPSWGESPYRTLRLAATVRLQDLLRMASQELCSSAAGVRGTAPKVHTNGDAILLSHLYVLVPVLDAAKHYWVGDDEVDKLLRHGAGWLAAHPARDMIVRRYLRDQSRLTRAALARLVNDGGTDPDAEADQQAGEEAMVEAPLSLHEQRLAAVMEALRAGGARRVLDLGCGEGRLLRLLLVDSRFTEIVGLDVSYRALEVARDRLRLDRLPQAQKDRLRLLHGSLTYRDRRLEGYDAAAAVEVIEHFDPPRLAAFERVVFEAARPALVVVTTPNAEYNVLFPTLPAGRFRHRDHRFEWTREQFGAWAGATAERFGYTVRVEQIGPLDPVHGAPSQMGVFTRAE